MIGLVHTCTLQKRHRMQKLTYTGPAGTATVGQTVTGKTSQKTAVISQLVTGYLVVKTLSGTFTNGEAISTTTWSGTLGTQTDYVNQSGEYQYYWSNDQLLVPCRLYYSGGGGRNAKGEIIHETGQLLDQPLKVALPTTCTVDALEYRVVSTVLGFTGTYDIATLYPLSGPSAITHYEAVLRKVTV